MSTITEVLDYENAVYLACVSKELGVIYSEIQESDYWVGGDEGGFTNNSNIFFETTAEAEAYYKRTYQQVFVFDNEDEAHDKCDELEAAYNKTTIET